MSSTCCGTGMLVLSTRVGSLVSLASTTSSASSMDTCVNRLVTLKLTRRSSGLVQMSLRGSMNLAELITTNMACPDRGSGFWRDLWPVGRLGPMQDTMGLRPEEDQSIWSKRRQGFQPCCEAGIREPTLSDA